MSEPQAKKKTTKRLRKSRHAVMRRPNRSKAGPTWAVRGRTISAVANVDLCAWPWVSA